MKIYKLDLDSKHNPIFTEIPTGIAKEVHEERSVEIREEKEEQHEAIPQQNKEKGKCEYCGAEFVKNKPNKRFCCVKCRVSFNRVHKK